jgi:long-chain-fatty-acyl-CoA reductase
VLSEEIIELPIVLNGRAIYPGAGRKHQVITYETGAEVHIPVVTEQDIAAIRSSNKFLLHDLHIQEIIAFLQKVGRFWDPGNSEHPVYQRALHAMARLTGYDLKLAQRELNHINVVNVHGPMLHDILDAELGSRFFLEEWIPRFDALVHAQPWGHALHIMVGNVPFTSIMSLVRSIITKNQTIAKLPKRDPITGLFFALSMAEVDPDHPVTRSMNVVYWPHGDAVEKAFLNLADVVCVWGGGAAVKKTKELVRPGVTVIEFGPKTSLAVIGREAATSRKVAIDLAHDVALYDQEACFSPQMVFVEGDIETFRSLLVDAMKLYSRILPKGVMTFDLHAQVSRARLEAYYNGNDVATSGDTEWTVVTLDDPSQINEHPLSRTIYLIAVEHIRDCAKYVTTDIQTVEISPWERNVEIREEVSLRGAAKITEVGLAQWHRCGIPHDGVYPVHALVRWVGVEQGLEHWGKYIEEGPMDTTKWLMMQESQLEHIE